VFNINSFSVSIGLTPNAAWRAVGWPDFWRTLRAEGDLMPLDHLGEPAYKQGDLRGDD
jgi:hypothetical protein